MNKPVAAPAPEIAPNTPNPPCAVRAPTSIANEPAAPPTPEAWAWSESRASSWTAS
jgi:hypothetical protein